MGAIQLAKLIGQVWKAVEKPHDTAVIVALKRQPAQLRARHRSSL